MQNELHCVRKRMFENEFSRNIILFRFNLILNCLNSINLTLSHLKFSKKKPRDQYWLKFKLNKIGFPRNLFCTLLYSLSQISDVATKLRSSFLRPTHGNFIRMKRGFILLHFFTTAVLAELPMTVHELIGQKILYIFGNGLWPFYHSVSIQSNYRGKWIKGSY